MSINDQYFTKEIFKKVHLGYKLFLPVKYAEDPNEKWPLILFLHGIKKRGEDLSQLNGYGLISLAESNEQFKFIVVAPQCPLYSNWTWERDAVCTLLSELISTYQVDPEKVYLTGFSMGGNGVWDLAAHHSELFAAVVPLSGWYQPEAAFMLKDLPVWAFHGEEDDVVPIQKTNEMVQALKGVGGNIKLTTYPGAKHNVMNETYSNPELYEWLLNHKRLIK